MTRPGVWPTLAAFHAADPRRAICREVTFGSEWYTARDRLPWRASWIQATSEFIIVQLAGKQEADHGPVELLGMIADEPVELGPRGWWGCAAGRAACRGCGTGSPSCPIHENRAQRRSR
jgi:hypothetical protein